MKYLLPEGIRIDRWNDGYEKCWESFVTKVASVYDESEIGRLMDYRRYDAVQIRLPESAHPYTCFRVNIEHLERLG